MRSSGMSTVVNIIIEVYVIVISRVRGIYAIYCTEPLIPQPLPSVPSTLSASDCIITTCRQSLYIMIKFLECNMY